MNDCVISSLGVGIPHQSVHLEVKEALWAGLTKSPWGPILGWWAPTKLGPSLWALWPILRNIQQVATNTIGEKWKLVSSYDLSIQASFTVPIPSYLRPSIFPRSQPSFTIYIQNQTKRVDSYSPLIVMMNLSSSVLFFYPSNKLF